MDLQERVDSALAVLAFNSGRNVEAHCCDRVSGLGLLVSWRFGGDSEWHQFEVDAAGCRL